MEQNTSRQGSLSGYAVRRLKPVSRKGLWLKLSAMLLVVAMLIAGGYYTASSDYFEVVRVESGSFRFTPKEDLDGILTGYLGRNIWTLSEGQVADSLTTLPWVRDLHVLKRLPGTIEVDFREWRPLLALEPSTQNGNALVMVEDGRVLEFPSHLPPPSLPVLVGVSCLPDTMTGCLRLDPRWASGVLSLLEAMAATGLETAGPVDFLVAREEGFAIVLQAGQGRLLVGRENFADRLARYMAARDHLEPGLQMDLRFRDRITCSRL